MRPLLASLRGQIEYVPAVPQAHLPAQYAWADLFVFPTIEDGYAVVLAQAAAAGLPILTTTNCGGPDFLIEGETGWIIPIRRPETLLERITWCRTHRDVFATMVDRIAATYHPRDWADVAADFETFCEASQRC